MNRYLLCFLLILAGCGGGGNTSIAPPPPPLPDASPGGIWTGTTTSNVVGTTVQTVGIITENGEARFLNEQSSQFFGFVSTSGNNLSGNLVGVTQVGFVWPDGSFTANFTLSGTVNERTSMSGTYSGGGDDGTFAVTFDPLYNRGSNLARTTGTWVQLDQFSNIVATFMINATGTVIGSDVAGCIYNGNITIIDTAFNAYRDSIVVSNCIIGGVNLNGTYAGLLVVADAVTGSGLNDIIVTGIDNSVFILTVTVFKL